MSTLTTQDKDIIALLLRSPDIGNGWRQVSQMLWKPVHMASPGLLEYDETTRRVRLTPAGETLAEWVVK